MASPADGYLAVGVRVLDRLTEVVETVLFRLDRGAEDGG